MGRIFEVRKASKFARWDKMAKNFTRIGKEIIIAVKTGGADPNSNPALRRCFQNARSVGMPKDRVEAAIKRAQGKELINYDEILYEGFDICHCSHMIIGSSFHQYSYTMRTKSFI